MHRRQWFRVGERQKPIAQFTKIPKLVVLHPPGRCPATVSDRQRVHDVCGTPEAGFQRVQGGETETGKIYIFRIFYLCTR
jgi:hypothetical protein